jgi:hypothetical protein
MTAAVLLKVQRRFFSLFVFVSVKAEIFLVAMRVGMGRTVMILRFAGWVFP